MSALTPETEAAIRERVEKATPGDAEFVAHAREDVPLLLAELDWLRETIAGSPDKAKRLASLMASTTRLVRIERDDARAALDAERAKVAAAEAERDALAAEVARLRREGCYPAPRVDSVSVSPHVHEWRPLWHHDYCWCGDVRRQHGPDCEKCDRVEAGQ